MWVKQDESPKNLNKNIPFYFNNSLSIVFSGFWCSVNSVDSTALYSTELLIHFCTLCGEFFLRPSSFENFTIIITFYFTSCMFTGLYI